MKLELRGNKDFWAGMMFIFIGTVAILMARHYPFGSTLRMGPGYFPVVLSEILIVFGLYVTIRGLRKNEKIQGRNWSIRALIILPLSTVLFGITMDHAGFVPGLIVLCFVSASSGREFNFKEVAAMTILLGVTSVAMFVWGLGLPYPLFQKFW